MNHFDPTIDAQLPFERSEMPERASGEWGHVRYHMEDQWRMVAPVSRQLSADCVEWTRRQAFGSDELAEHTFRPEPASPPLNFKARPLPMHLVDARHADGVTDREVLDRRQACNLGFGSGNQ